MYQFGWPSSHMWWPPGGDHWCHHTMCISPLSAGSFDCDPLHSYHRAPALLTRSRSLTLGTSVVATTSPVTHGPWHTPKDIVSKHYEAHLLSPCRPAPGLQCPMSADGWWPSWWPPGDGWPGGKHHAELRQPGPLVLLRVGGARGRPGVRPQGQAGGLQPSGALWRRLQDHDLRWESRWCLIILHTCFTKLFIFVDKPRVEMLFVAMLNVEPNKKFRLMLILTLKKDKIVSDWFSMESCGLM